MAQVRFARVRIQGHDGAVGERRRVQRLGTIRDGAAQGPCRDDGINLFPVGDARRHAGVIAGRVHVVPAHYGAEPFPLRIAAGADQNPAVGGLVDVPGRNQGMVVARPFDRLRTAQQ